MLFFGGYLSKLRYSNNLERQELSTEKLAFCTVDSRTLEKWQGKCLGNFKKRNQWGNFCWKSQNPETVCLLSKIIFKPWKSWKMFFRLVCDRECMPRLIYTYLRQEMLFSFYFMSDSFRLTKTLNSKKMVCSFLL